jgi:hypothetical protein
VRHDIHDGQHDDDDQDHAEQRQARAAGGGHCGVSFSGGFLGGAERGMGQRLRRESRNDAAIDWSAPSSGISSQEAR